MASTLQFNFSHSFNGTVWSTLAVSDSDLLILEIRNENKREVRFSALDFKENKFLWQEIMFDETWWIGLTAATSQVLLLHLYQNMDNPDEKGLIAWHIHQQKILWSIRDFSFNSMDGSKVFGYLTKQDGRLAEADILTGKIIENVKFADSTQENILVQKPFQYAEGTENFNTVKSFLADTMAIEPLASIEYLEDSGLIFISYHVQLENMANFLVVLTEDGDQVLHEKIGWQLKGIGLETFFLLAGCLFFVRNKCELVSYRII